MNLPAITPLLLTFNEEANIGRVLERLTWAKRIVIIDSYSTDDTLRTATAFPQVDLIQRTFDNHTAQWNFGLAQVTSQWVLSLDADYVLSDSFIEAVRHLPDEPDKAGYYASFNYCVFGKPLRASLYPPRLVLFKKDRGTYVQDGHTQVLHLDGPSGTLSGSIDHDDRKPLSHWLQAQQRYAGLEAEKLRTTPVAELSLTDRIRRKRLLAPLLTPFYCLFRKGLILDGKAGLYYTFQRTYAELLLSLRLLDADLRDNEKPC